MATIGDLQFIKVQSNLSVDVTGRGSGALNCLRALGVLDNGARVFFFPEPVWRHLEACLPGVQVWVPLE